MARRVARPPVAATAGPGQVACPACLLSPPTGKGAPFGPPSQSRGCALESPLLTGKGEPSGPPSASRVCRCRRSASRSATMMRPRSVAWPPAIRRKPAWHRTMQSPGTRHSPLLPPTAAGCTARAWRGAFDGNTNRRPWEIWIGWCTVCGPLPSRSTSPSCAAAAAAASADPVCPQRPSSNAPAWCVEALASGSSDEPVVFSESPWGKPSTDDGDEPVSSYVEPMVPSETPVVSSETPLPDA